RSIRSSWGKGWRRQPRSWVICSWSRTRCAPASATTTLDTSEDMGITLTESAARRVSEHLGRRGRGVGLRLGVRKAGCSGFAYVNDYADEIGSADVVFDDRGVRVVVDRASLPYIDGTEVDFVKKGLNEALKLHNPNVTDESGWGGSIKVQGA